MARSNKQRDIIETAKKLFFRHGTRRVTIEEICRTAKVSKVTFYKYFSNKAGLVDTIGNELVDTSFSRFDEIGEMDIPYPEKIQRMTDWKMRFFSQIKDEFLSEMVSLDSVTQKAKERYLQNFARAQEHGEIRQDLSPELIWLVTEKLNELIEDGNWKTVFDDYQLFQEQMRTLFFFGLLTREVEV